MNQAETAYTPENYSLSQSDKARLNTLLESVAKHSEIMLGYPCARDFNYDQLKPFTDYHLNNVGDPFSSSTSKIDSRAFEREVLEFWADLVNAPKENWWGYVTNGGTEGNLYGLYLARELYPDGTVYYSEDTHYSVAKNLHFLKMRHRVVKAQDNGEIDYEDLQEKLDPTSPVIIFANIGTTMTEAKDDIAKIKRLLDSSPNHEYYIHSDAAMSGAIAPFLDPKPKFDFADGANSISISGHKFIGSPIPCGLVFAQKENTLRIAREIEYIGNLDTTITGSRNGFTPLALWQAVRAMGHEGMQQRVQHCLDLASFLVEELQAAGIPAWRNENAITVVFPTPRANIVDKWQLATSKGIAHVITMPNLSKKLLSEFVDELKRENTNLSQERSCPQN